MRLLDQVIDYDANELVVISKQHRDLKNPLRRSCGMLPISAGIEFAGQATALHGALLEGSDDGKPRQGFLVMARDVSWRVTRLDQVRTELLIQVLLISRNDQSAMYQFHISSPADSMLLSGRLAVYFEARPQ